MDTHRSQSGIVALLLVCAVLATQRDSASATSSDHSGQRVGQDECCACGHAMYTVEFQGMWSRNTHPKGFPDEKNSFQLHWSNLVGASHSNDYRVWEYGQFSSRAVKEVCEYGSSRSLENELKENSEKIRTVVKTEQLWGPKRILEPLNAVYTVNKKKHLLSLITMVGPSPDWCLGISGESMCGANCTWKDTVEVDLYPWDAGTDSRVTYLGRKMPTVPAERIHRLTNTNPNDRDSPFYGVDIKPFARLTMRKKKEACTDDEGKSTSAEKSPSTEELVSMMKKKMMMNKKFEMEKCATSPWSEWADCSNSCGSGVRERRRMLKNPGVTADMCDLELVDTQSCVGDCKARTKKLSDSFIMRHDEERDPTDTCAVTEWSVWSPCSATCGLGMKERWRMFLFNPEQRVDCGIHLMEKDLCRGEIFDCQKAIMMKNFTAICQQPLDVGPCRGDFPRWFYNHTMEKCQTFSYGGCRGNENRFDTESECVDLCADYMASLHRNGGMGRKHRMSLQDMEMQKVMMKEKERMMAKQRMREKQQTMQQDMLRKQEMMRKLRMMEEQRKEQERKAAEMKRQMMRKHSQNQGDEEVSSRPERGNTKMMRRKQRMMKKKQMMERRRRRRRRQRKDEDGERVDCMVTPWSNWSECSATCGKGIIMKTRMIKVEAKNGGWRCPRRLVKKKKCRQKKCPVDCEMSQWNEWSACTKTCGDSSVQIRKRRRVRKPKRGGLACPSRKERRFCNVPLCLDSDMRERMRRFRLYHRRY
ncbi:hypothetical protein RRG08_041170 [Elysia crispata]|uniref:Spondin-1 n=1 Tax=Elysia crispata TaxID=231223 RepID=A0AAE0XXT3_9GAST|nr:hypothetical protein RRG08_041170 [Elysia crispata]